MALPRIERRFAERRAEGRCALVVYLCVGDPSVEDTKQCAIAAARAGADVLELGVPFSDPTADGPVIAAAAYRAIRSGGSLRAALDVARAVRATSDAAVVLFSYYNPVLAYGDEALPKAAIDAGADGLLVVDLPPEEGAALRAAAKEAELAVVPLIAPTSGAERERRVLEGAGGFVYYVSLTGVTGAGDAPLGEAGRAAAALRERAGLPVVVGFGIDGPDKARLVAQEGVDGVVVGTAIVRAMGSQASTAGRVEAVSSLVSALRAAL